MNLLKTLFNYPELTEETDFFETTYPLTNNFFNGNQEVDHVQSEATAIVKVEIRPGQLGRVKLQGVRWRACCDRAITLSEGAQVKVLGRRANILVVEPIAACIAC
ncbi:MAG: NfeD family protein [Cyanobacteria bacterium P01_C01_bin.120]